MRFRHLPIWVALTLVLAACGTSADTTTTTEPTPSSTAPATSVASTTTTTASPATTTTLASTTTTSTTSTTTTMPTTTTTLFPGEPIEIGPAAGDVLGVIGVRYDDVLNVREKPGTNQPIVTTLEPTFDEIVALGAARRLTRSIWFEVEAKGTRGWVSSSFVAYIGPTDDVTSAVVDTLGEIPVASSMDELAAIVASTVVSIDPPSEVVTVVAATIGDLGEITIDVIGLGDDAQVGTRLVIFGQSEDGGATFGLKSVEATELCGRGVTEEGFCI